MGLTGLDIFLLWCDDRMGYPKDLAEVHLMIDSDIASFEKMQAKRGRVLPDILWRLARVEFLKLQLSSESRQACLRYADRFRSRKGHDIRTAADEPESIPGVQVPAD